LKNVLELEHQTTSAPISICYGEKVYTKYMLKHYGFNNYTIDKSAVTTILTNNRTGKYSIVVGINKLEDVYQLKGLIVHELSHVVTELMNEYGFVCDEFRSYTLQWLYQEVMVFIDNLLKIQ
jgi:hypothetical protein